MTPEAIARSEAALATTSAALSEITARFDSVTSRTRRIVEQQKALIDRRSQGQEEESDGGMYALLTADLQRLREIEADIETERKDRFQHHQRALQALAHEKAEYDRAVAVQQADVLRERAREIEALLIDAISEIADLTRKTTRHGEYLGATQIFQMSPRLVKYVQTGAL